ncbi:unnamed protein product, partial [Ascophyllum nodosum]
GNSGAGITTQAGTNDVSIRQPSAALSIVMVSQLQFLATLSLVDNAAGEESIMTDLAASLRWVNLWWSADVHSTYCGFGNDDGALGASVFIGNLALIVGVLLVLFLLHVAIISGVEAYWLSKDRAEREVKVAQKQGVSISELRARRLDGPHAIRAMPANESRPNACEQRPPLPATNIDGDDRNVITRGKMLTMDRPNLRAIAECREKSGSAWLHFPHIELMFVLYAFEGAVAAQLAVIRRGECYLVFFLALAAFLCYPVLMLVSVWRTVFVRVRSDALIEFKPASNDESQLDNVRGFFAKFRASWLQDYSLFSWAETGQWQTVEVVDEATQREGNWFRIGFEPLFVDYTKSGSFFAVVTLVESGANACVGVFVDDSASQLLFFSFIGLFSFTALVIFRPFANKVVNAMGAFAAASNALTTGLMAASAMAWEDGPNAKRVDTVVVFIQLITL